MHEPTEVLALDAEAWDELAVRAYGPGREAWMSLLLAANPDLVALSVLPGGTPVLVPAPPAPPVTTALPPWRRTTT